MKVHALFVFKYTYPKIPWEIQNTITDYLPSNFLEYVIENYSIEWDWDNLSRRANCSYIAKTPTLPWNWKLVSLNLTINMKFVLQHKDKDILCFC